MPLDIDFFILNVESRGLRAWHWNETTPSLCISLANVLRQGVSKHLQRALSPPFIYPPARPRSAFDSSGSTTSIRTRERDTGVGVRVVSLKQFRRRRSHTRTRTQVLTQTHAHTHIHTHEGSVAGGKYAPGMYESRRTTAFTHTERGSTLYTSLLGKGRWGLAMLGGFVALQLQRPHHRGGDPDTDTTASVGLVLWKCSLCDRRSLTD